MASFQRPPSSERFLLEIIMKDGYGLVRFCDDKVVKIAHFTLIRHKNKMPFKPKIAEDFPSGPAVQVKWEKSLTQGSFSCDGFYDAEVLAISSK